MTTVQPIDMEALYTAWEKNDWLQSQLDARDERIAQLQEALVAAQQKTIDVIQEHYLALIALKKEMTLCDESPKH